MPRQCKLQDTGESVPVDQAFRAPNKKYYSSEAAWQKVVINKEYRSKCVDFLMSLLDYKEGMKLPTITYKKIQEYEPYGLDVLYATMLSQQSSCEWALQNKDFRQETAKIFYLFAIFQNHIMDEYKQKVQAEKSKRQAEKQVENAEVGSLLESEEFMFVGNTKCKKDLSGLLGEEPWI